jgi:hypothetical protein
MFILSELHGTSKRSRILLLWGHPIPGGPGAAWSKLTRLPCDLVLDNFWMLFYVHKRDCLCSWMNYSNMPINIFDKTGWIYRKPLILIDAFCDCNYTKGHACFYLFQKYASENKQHAWNVVLSFLWKYQIDVTKCLKHMI